VFTFVCVWRKIVNKTKLDDGSFLKETASKKWCKGISSMVVVLPVVANIKTCGTLFFELITLVKQRTAKPWSTTVGFVGAVVVLDLKYSISLESTCKNGGKQKHIIRSDNRFFEEKQNNNVEVAT
jgi:hypothetical protein